MINSECENQPLAKGGDVRGQTLQVDELLDEREGGRDHGLRGDKLDNCSVANLGNAIRGITHCRQDRKDIHNPVSNKS